MKSKELIKMLQEVDPSGEIECCVGNINVVGVEVLPAYYDGTLQVVKLDEFGNPVSAKYVRNGQKIVLKIMDIYNCILDSINHDCSETSFHVDYSELSENVAAETKASHEDARQWSKDTVIGAEVELFINWAKSKLNNLVLDADFDINDFSEHALGFATKNISPADPINCRVGMSYRDERFAQWDKKFLVDLNQLDDPFIFKRDEL